MRRRDLLLGIGAGGALLPPRAFAFLLQPPRDWPHTAAMQELVSGLLAYLRGILGDLQQAEQRYEPVRFPSPEILLGYQRRLDQLATEAGSIKMTRDPAVQAYARRILSRYGLKLPSQPAETIRMFAGAIGHLAAVLHTMAEAGFGPNQGGNLAARQRLGALFDAINGVLQIGSVMGLLFQAA